VEAGVIYGIRANRVQKEGGRTGARVRVCIVSIRVYTGTLHCTRRVDHTLQTVIIVIEIHLVRREVIGEIERATSSDTTPSTVLIHALWCSEGAQPLGRAVRYQPSVGHLSLTALCHLLE
jgi:hypothetical protein